MPSKTEALYELEWRRCRGTSEQDVDALRYFAETFCRIQHPEKGAILLPLRPAQSEILDTWLQERYSIVLKARQIGWSTLVAIYVLWLSFFYEDRIVVMLSKTERDAEKLLYKTTYAYDRLPPWMREKGPKRLTRNLKDIKFGNGSSVESLPSKEDPARGSAVTLVVVDEWAFLDNPEDAWSAIEPITDVGGRVIGLSTANGWGDFFHSFWVKAKTGVTAFKPMFYPWWANSDRDGNWYEVKKANMEEWQLHQEYPSDEEEAFIKSGNPFFDVEALAKIVPILPTTGYLDVLESAKSPHWLEGQGPLQVWKFPERGHGYVIGADVAEGLDYGDYSSAHVIDVETAEVCAVYHAHLEADLFGDRLFELGYWYMKALIGCEVNNHGLTTLKQLQRRVYPRLYYRRELDGRTKKVSTKIGWYTSRQSKPLMIGELAKSLREDLKVWDQYTIAELRQFVRDEKGLTHGSPYDDRVMSLGIANQMRQYAHVFKAKDEIDDFGTFNYYRRKALGKDKKGERTPIGAHNRPSRPYR